MGTPTISLTCAGNTAVLMYSATLSCACTNPNLPEAYTTGNAQDYHSYTYSNPVYSWTFNPGSGSGKGQSLQYTFTKLNKGQQNTLNASLTVTCTETDYHYYEKFEDKGSYQWVQTGTTTEDIIDPETGEVVDTEEVPVYEYLWVPNWQWVPYESTSIKENYPSGSASSSYIVYTRPGKFNYYNFVANIDIINSNTGLTADKVRAWCIHAGQYLSWNSQKDQYNDLMGQLVTAGELITADWFNSCAAGIGIALRVSNNSLLENSLIKAEYFETLGNAISIE